MDSTSCNASKLPSASPSLSSFPTYGSRNDDSIIPPKYLPLSKRSNQQSSARDGHNKYNGKAQANDHALRLRVWRICRDLDQRRGLRAPKETHHEIRIVRIQRWPTVKCRVRHDGSVWWEDARARARTGGTSYLWDLCMQFHSARPRQ